MDGGDRKSLSEKTPTVDQKILIIHVSSVKIHT